MSRDLVELKRICKIHEYHTTDIPADTRRKLNVHKTFRRRPERLLNVLCTFHLRRVSTKILTGYPQMADFLNILTNSNQIHLLKMTPYQKSNETLYCGVTILN